MIRRLAAAALLGLTGLILLPAPAQAHPLGNFTTNQYAGVRVGSAGIDVDYVLDLAELPAYQATRDEIDTDRDGTPSPAERNTYAANTCTAAAATGTLTVGGRAVALTGTPHALTFPPGAGGLTTLRLECVLHTGTRPGADTTIEYRHQLYTDRIGWREITAVGDRYTLTRTDVPAASISKRLTAYPTATVTSDVRTATLTVRPGGPPAPAAAYTGTDRTQARGADRLTAWFTDLIGRPQLTLGVGVLAFVIALVLGGAHAVAPGHGKTIMAAYLVGTRGRLAQALTVAGTVAATHTAGVLVLGILLATSLQLAPDSIYAWLRLVSGLVVALVGAQLLRRALRRRRPGVAEGHSEGVALSDALVDGRGHVHGGGDDHGHSHEGGHGHSHDDGHSHDHAHGSDHVHGRDHVAGHDHDHSHGHDHAGGHVHAQDDGRHGLHRHPDDHDHEYGPHEHDPAHDHQPGLVPAQSHRPSHAADVVPAIPHEPAPGRPDGHGGAAVAPHQHPDDPADLVPTASHRHTTTADPADRPGTAAAAPARAGEPTAVSGIASAPDHADQGRDAEVTAAPAGRRAPLTHSHGGHAHTHYLPEPDEPLKLRTLLAMGFAGGLSPSPSAVVVLLGAAALGRAWYGVLIVLAYGIGLAATLIGIGFALARWGERLHRASSGRWSRLLTHRMPALTAATILAVGTGMVVFAAAELIG